MTSHEIFRIDVIKPFDNKPIPKEEKERIKTIITEEIFKIASKFDGDCQTKIKVELEAKGNM
ncbi:MAG: hypothetical protein GY936_06685 [Ignavibacteriae bacterium]|nr:hypothetical protein [Ignavibacteriota bacterium]